MNTFAASSEWGSIPFKAQKIQWPRISRQSSIKHTAISMQEVKVIYPVNKWMKSLLLFSTRLDWPKNQRTIHWRFSIPISKSIGKTTLTKESSASSASLTQNLTSLRCPDCLFWEDLQLKKKIFTLLQIILFKDLSMDIIKRYCISLRNLQKHMWNSSINGN